MLRAVKVADVPLQRNGNTAHALHARTRNNKQQLVVSIILR